MDILKSGDRFSVRTKLGEVHKYEFVGVDLEDAGAIGNGGTGCQYIVLRNLDDETYTCVERAWLSSQVTGRKIQREEE